MFDREFLRDQQLIEERIEYEDDFIDMDVRNWTWNLSLKIITIKSGMSN